MQRSQRYRDQQAADRKKRRIRNIIIFSVLLVVLIVGLVLVLRSMGSTTGVTVTPLPCRADQDVTIFGENVLYYDNASIHCVSPGGGIRWSFPVGYGASFAVSDSVLVVWNGNQLYIVDKNGKPTYNDSMSQDIQFARAGDKYVAVVIGEDTAPDLIIKRLDGSQVDEEIDAFSHLMLLDVGFYGEEDQYMWTLAMDVYGTAINTMMNTFRVGSMNTGEVNLGSFLAYKVLFSNNKLLVFTTQQMYVYDYKATQNQSETQLVYGWQLIDSCDVRNHDANLLLATNAQLNGNAQVLQDLRVISGTTDRRYTLPSSCVGAGITENNLYAVSSGFVYRADLNNRRFYGYVLPLPENVEATGFVGLTSGGRAVIECGDQVYAITLPQS